MGVTLSINDLRSVTSKMAQFENLDYTGFSFSFLKRRLGHVFSNLRIKKLTQFTESLSDAGFREDVNYYMAVGVTEMFRDPGFWRSIRSNVLPFFQKQDGTIWFPDTSSGEELFSLTILLKEEGLLDRVRIFGQHPSEKRCAEVAGGFLEASDQELNYNNYKRLEERDRFENYFHRENSVLRLNPELLSNCNISKGWPVASSEESESVDFIIFRNACIYYTFQKREEVLKTVVNRLKPGGFIAIGVKEAVPASLKDILTPMDEKESIYRKAGIKSH